jgi:DNA-binding transcriptional LysR family regulator
MAIVPGGDAARMPTLGELRAFIAVAEELHFARAARRLGMAPPPLSQAIRRLEDTLGAILFVRTPRSVTLTEEGEELLPRARDILARMEEAQAAVTRPNVTGRGEIVIGFASNAFAELTAPIVRAYRRAHPGVRVVLRDVTSNGVDAIVGGEVDVALCRPPISSFDDARLLSVDVVAEPRAAILSKHHRLAGADHISIEDLRHDRFVAVGPAIPDICAYWNASDARGGEAPLMGGEAWTVPDVLRNVAYMGEVITSFKSILRFFREPELVAVPLDDVSDTMMSVISRTEQTSPRAEELLTVVRAVSERMIDLVPGARVLDPEPVPAG